MTRQNWALFREQKKSVHPLCFPTEGTCSSSLREGKTLVWGHPAKRHRSPSDSRLCGSPWLKEQRTMGAGMLLKFPPQGRPLVHFWASRASFPAALQFQQQRKLFSTWLQSPGLPPLPLGSYTIAMPLKIKPGWLPAPSGRLLISGSYDLGYLLPRNFPSPQHTT